MTYSSKVIEFYANFPAPDVFDTRLQFHNPFDSPPRKTAIETFCSKFYNDENPRTHLLGINPSRFTPSSTGVNYTDGYALEKFCGIKNDFSKSRELTANFFYEMINALGSPESFYSAIFAWAALPVAITKEGEYVNYYEFTDEEMKKVVTENIDWMRKLPSTGRLVIVGSGDNQKYIQALPGYPFGYKEILIVPHPRWIMQYNKAKISDHIETYRKALGL